jgi:hypothetical protein
MTSNSMLPKMERCQNSFEDECIKKCSDIPKVATTAFLVNRSEAVSANVLPTKLQAMVVAKKGLWRAARRHRRFSS